MSAKLQARCLSIIIRLLCIIVKPSGISTYPDSEELLEVLTDLSEVYNAS